MVLVWLAAIVGCAVTANGEHHSISSAQELIALFQGASGSTFNADIELLDDLDFSGSGLALPLGLSSSDITCTAYSGVF